MILTASDVKTMKGVPCVPCEEARITRGPHGDDRTTTRKLEKLHVVLVVPFDPSMGGAAHFVSAVDDNTELGFATTLKRNFQAGRAQQDVIAHLMIHVGLKVKVVRYDGAGVPT